VRGGRKRESAERGERRENKRPQKKKVTRTVNRVERNQWKERWLVTEARVLDVCV